MRCGGLRGGRRAARARRLGVALPRAARPSAVTVVTAVTAAPERRRGNSVHRFANTRLAIEITFVPGRLSGYCFASPVSVTLVTGV